MQEYGIGKGSITMLKIIKVEELTFFNHSHKVTMMLQTDLQIRGKTYYSLTQAVKTRWNSIYFILDRIFDALDSINVVLSRIKHRLSL